MSPLDTPVNRAAGTTELSALRVDGDRLLARLEELAAIGATERGGVTRLAYSVEDVAACDLVASWMQEAGMRTRVDAGANLIGSTPGTPASTDLAEVTWWVLGSHLDTVVDGGHLDGAYGVVAAVEVATVLAESGVALTRGLRVVAFSDEEGANGTPGMLGSQVIAGVLPEGELERFDDEGVRMAARVFSAGGAPDEIERAAWPAGSIAGFLELHIEQGPVLAETGVQIGVVEAITGRGTAEVTITGSANHAGTTPMHLRQDAMTAAAEVVLAVEQLATDGITRVATSGHLRVTPNVRNVVAGQVALGLDIRDVDDTRIARAIEVLRERAAEIAARRDVHIEVTEGQSVTPMPCDGSLVADIAAAADALSFTSMRMPSGAGHDAQVIARVAPIGMVFVPSRDGVSHNPAEYTDPAALVNGADVLLHSLLAADRRSSS